MLTHLGKHLILVSPRCACADALPSSTMIEGNHDYDAEAEMSAMRKASHRLSPDAKISYDARCEIVTYPDESHLDLDLDLVWTEQHSPRRLP
jgi:hypothetical protein